MIQGTNGDKSGLDQTRVVAVVVRGVRQLGSAVALMSRAVIVISGVALVERNGDKVCNSGERTAIVTTLMYRQ